MVSEALRVEGRREFVVHTGQHYDDDMSGVFFREMSIREPDVNLGIGSASHGLQTAEMLRGLEPILSQRRPDWVIVYGDTNSTLAGALAASKLGVPVAHVEAGMRSYIRTMPEEINRVVADHLSTLLFCATETSVMNLQREGICAGVDLTGDVMYDAALKFAPVAAARSRILADASLEPNTYALLTIHRAENVDSADRLRKLMGAVLQVDLPIVFPIHPRTRQRLEALGLMDRVQRAIRVLPPVGYLDMLALESQARIVLTDSGGVQREAFFFSVPSVILRAETEWPELVNTGASVLAGSDFANLAMATEIGQISTNAAPIFGDGRASERIAARLAEPSNRSALAARVPEAPGPRLAKAEVEGSE